MPLWIALPWTALAIVIFVVYSLTYGPRNFLWFSDLSLFMLAAAMWMKRPLLASMTLLGVGLPELFWNAGFFLHLFTGREVLGLSAYMFDTGIPVNLRALSLFHVALPPLLLWMAMRLGYDRRAFLAQTLLAELILPLSYFLSTPAQNINWVYGPTGTPQHWTPPLAYLAIVMLAFPLLIYLPTHLLARTIFPYPINPASSLA